MANTTFGCTVGVDDSGKICNATKKQCTFKFVKDQPFEQCAVYAAALKEPPAAPPA